MTAADSTRCAAVAESLLALPPHELPLTRPLRDAHPPRPPLNADTVIQTMFVVRPDGTADTASVSIQGIDDPGFRRAMTRFVSRQRFEVPIVQGCPAWSRGDILMIGVVERIRRP